MNDVYSQSLFNRPSEEEERMNEIMREKMKECNSTSLPPSGVATNSWVIQDSPVRPQLPPWGPDIDPFKKKMEGNLGPGSPTPIAVSPGLTDLLQHYSTLVLHLQSEIRRLSAELEKVKKGT